MEAKGAKDVEDAPKGGGGGGGGAKGEVAESKGGGGGGGDRELDTECSPDGAIPPPLRPLSRRFLFHRRFSQART
jgi:hypothetical protein